MSEPVTVEFSAEPDGAVIDCTGMDAVVITHEPGSKTVTVRATVLPAVAYPLLLSALTHAYQSLAEEGGEGE